MANRNRYKQFERTMTIALIANTNMFIAYLIAASFHIVWLKVIFAILCLLQSVLGLYILYSSRELTKPRSLWMSCGYFALLCCTAVSLILAYPG